MKSCSKRTDTIDTERLTVGHRAFRALPCWTAAFLALLTVGASFAAPSVVVREAWGPATPPGARTAAIYLEIDNDGANTDLLYGAFTDIADRVEFHTRTHRDGVMTMTPMETVAIPAGQTVVFKPHGRHLMLFGLKRPMLPGDTIPVTLEFRNAGRVIAAAAIRDIRQ